MGKHAKLEHKHVKGETDPVKIKAEMGRIRTNEDAERQRIIREQSGR